MIYYHSRDLRVGRRSIPGHVYLLTCCSYRRMPVFRDYHTGRLVVKALRDTTTQASTLAYVVMPDHLHWLIKLELDASLDRVMQLIKGRSARQVNSLLGRSGRLWAPGYHDRALRRDADIRGCAQYIIANPLRAGLVEDIGQYPLWDSFHLPMQTGRGGAVRG